MDGGGGELMFITSAYTTPTRRPYEIIPTDIQMTEKRRPNRDLDVTRCSVMY